MAGALMRRGLSGHMDPVPDSGDGASENDAPDVPDDLQVIGDHPSGGVVVRDGDGQHYVVQGASATPIPPPTDTPAPTNGGAPLGPPASAAGGEDGGWWGAAKALAGRVAMPSGMAIASGVGDFVDKLKADAQGQPLFKVGPTGLAPDSALAKIKVGEPAPEAPAAGATGGQPAPSSAPAADKVDPKDLVTVGAAPKPAAGAPKGAGPATPAQPDAASQAFEAEAQAAGEEGKAKAAQSEAVAKATGDAQASIGKMRDDYLAAADEARKANLAQWQKVNDEIDQVGKLKVDPNAWWKSRTSGQKVLGTIAVALGGFAKSMGGEDTGGQMIADAIGRDVHAQEFNIENRRAAAGQHQTALTHFYEVTNSKPAAIAAANAWGLKQADLKIEEMKASMQSPVDIAHANQMQAEIRQRAQEWKLKAAQAQSEMYSQALEQKLKKMQIDAMAKMGAAGLPPGYHGVKVGSTVIPIRDEKQAEKVNDVVVAHGIGTKALDALDDMADQEGFDLRAGLKGVPEDWQTKVDSIANNLNRVQGNPQQMQQPMVERFVHNVQHGLIDTPEKWHREIQAIRDEYDSGLQSNVGQVYSGDARDLLPRRPTLQQRQALRKAGRK